MQQSIATLNRQQTDNDATLSSLSIRPTTTKSVTATSPQNQFAMDAKRHATAPLEAAGNSTGSRNPTGKEHAALKVKPTVAVGKKLGVIDQAGGKKFLPKLGNMETRGSGIQTGISAYMASSTSKSQPPSGATRSIEKDVKRHADKQPGEITQAHAHAKHLPIAEPQTASQSNPVKKMEHSERKKPPVGATAISSRPTGPARRTSLMPVVAPRGVQKRHSAGNVSSGSENMPLGVLQATGEVRRASYASSAATDGIVCTYNLLILPLSSYIAEIFFSL